MQRVKKVIFLFFLICIPYLGVTQKIQILDSAQNDKTLNSIYLRFLGKEVNSLLSSENCKSYKSFTFSDEPPGVLQGAVIEMPDSSLIEIHVSVFKFVKQFDSNRKWSKKLFYKEKISQIIIYKKGKRVLDIKSNKVQSK